MNLRHAYVASSTSLLRRFTFLSTPFRCSSFSSCLFSLAAPPFSSGDLFELLERLGFDSPLRGRVSRSCSRNSAQLCGVLWKMRDAELGKPTQCIHRGSFLEGTVNVLSRRWYSRVVDHSFTVPQLVAAQVYYKFCRR